MLIQSADFIKSSANIAGCPDPDFPEYAFTGRSNVGKSSLINMLTGRRKLAKTSSTPGKTQLINHFLINNSWYLVDLPGYGYAKVPVKMKKGMERLIVQYIEKSVNLVTLFLLIDSGHSPFVKDIAFINWMGENQVPFKLVFTKCDKLSPGKLKLNIESYFKLLEKDWENLPGYFCTSVPGFTGKEDILNFISKTNLELNA